MVTCVIDVEVFAQVEGDQRRVVPGEEVLAGLLQLPVLGLDEFLEASLQEFLPAVVDHMEGAQAPVHKLKELLGEHSAFLQKVSLHLPWIP